MDVLCHKREKIATKKVRHMKIIKEKKPSALREYLDEYGIKQNWFARQLGISRKTVSSICNGAHCSSVIALQIEGVTDGDVKAEDICWKTAEIKILREEL